MRGLTRGDVVRVFFFPSLSFLMTHTSKCEFQWASQTIQSPRTPNTRRGTADEKWKENWEGR